MNQATKEDLVSVIRLIRSENVGPKTFWHLISLYKTAKIALENIADLSIRGGRDKPIKIFPKSLAEAEIKTCDARGVAIISYQNPDFPNLLKNIDDCPPLLFCLGDIKLFNRNTVAIVGSRNASINGLRFAYKVAKVKWLH